MKQRALLNRREFVQWIGCSSALGAAGAVTPWLTGPAYAEDRTTPRFAYVGYSSHATSRAEQGIQVFAIHSDAWGERWTPVQSVASENPSFLVLHPSQRFLYVANEIDRYRDLPTASVEAYAIHPRDGRLTPLNRQPLSLSGTMPRHLAISPDGRNLVVAIHGGGAWNVLAINADGSLGRVSGILKETGSGPDREYQDASHPQALVFDTTGQHLLGADLGSDRLSVFTLAGDSLHLHDRIAVLPGNGPRHLALHPAGHLIYVANELESSVSCYSYDAARGKFRDRLHHVSTRPDKVRALSSALAIHPSGMFLYTSNFRRESGQSPDGEITAWRIDTASGALTPIQHWTEPLRAPRGMTMISSGTGLLVLSGSGDGILRLCIDPDSGRLSHPAQMADVSSPISFAMKYL